MFNADRDLMDPYNGIARGSTVARPKLKKSSNQKYFEGPDVYGDFKVGNDENELSFIRQVQNTNDEVKQLDSTLFSTRLDTDIEQRLESDDRSDNKSNIMGFNASDGMRLIHQAANASTEYENQIALLPDVVSRGIKATSGVAKVIEQLDSGKYKLSLPSDMPEVVKKLLMEILANPKSVVERAADIIALLPEFSKLLKGYIQLARDATATGFKVYADLQEAAAPILRDEL